MSSTSTEEEERENVEELESNPRTERESETETEGQTLELGDVIKFHSPDNEIYDNNIFIIDYIDENQLSLINTTNLQKRVLQIKEGILGDGFIKGIELFFRNPEKGYARQNGLLPDKWVNIYFGGEYPSIITGKITNLEADMIELTLPDNDVIYLNFAYKGIPLDLPIETIELRDAPQKEVEVEVEKQQYQEEIGELIGEESESDVDSEESRSMNIQMPVETVKDQAREFIIYANEIEFGEELGAIKQYVGIDRSKQRFNIEAQTNDLLDELLSDIPSVERTSTVLNNIHIMIERFKQLRLSFSTFDDYGNVIDSLNINMTINETFDRDIFDLETDDGPSFIRIAQNCLVNIDGIFGDQLTLVSDDLPQPIVTPQGKELPYNFNGYTVNGQSYVYSGFFSL